MTVAELDEDLRIIDLDIYFDPMDMFRQMDEVSGEGGSSNETAEASKEACPFMSKSS